ncbi:hypothetical protein P170DRAFT_437799 [Aspergillus steynii IBT 23096]|uniref:DUF2415 domain-containing protein n=1 Tax=Aspergillus steynii IBT 23096 TaxID=1392250 RepID=A0A2I2G5D2_9EURO|nr:uncharacterized protein P170DRAFT_437799 [Aspergillus steynii IBT 23096]PLB48087.1 hypothetical protein P170DRAFT_437799 [Aspergillus steynii IBT 23096]
MTTDSALSYHPTEALILPTKRRFFPFKIPNFHQQLRNYISTADPDRIYVVVDRVIYAIHISTEKRETLAVIPFEPKCLAAGNGWVAVGGSDNGECAFVSVADRNGRVRDASGSVISQSSDVDSALPIDLESSARSSPSWLPGEEPGASRESGRTELPDVQLHKFGGSIVNSVTLHRLPGDEKGSAAEDIVVLSNNDKTVTIYSLTRSKVVKVLHHQACMNYAIMSPDSSILAAVGDETRAYFYDVTRDLDSTTFMENGEKFFGWNWDLLSCVEMDIGTRFDDGCCFSIAFSQFSRLCAIGSQSGVITVFDVKTLRSEPNAKSSVICHFNSSRLSCNGGAVRCMTFAPEPWDLLVWLEEKGRAGIADVRQAFVRRQILQLDMNEPGIQEIRTEPLLDDSVALGFDLDSRFSLESRNEVDAAQRAILDSIESPSNEQRGSSDNLPMRESLIHDISERERLIVEFLNTARWTSTLDEGLAERRARANANPQPIPRSRFQGATDVPNRISRPTSPLRHGEPSTGVPRETHPAHAISLNRRPNARRQSSVVLSHDTLDAGSRTQETSDPNLESQPSITLTWTASPSEMQSATPENPLRSSESSSNDLSSSNNEASTAHQSQRTIGRPSANFDYSNTAMDTTPRPRTHQSHSRSRRSGRQDGTSEARHEPSRLSSSELVTNVAALERLRRQRQIISEAHNRNNHRERYRQQLLGSEQSRSSRWMRSILDELPDRSLGAGYRDQDTGSTAGIGWGADGRTLYIATVDGIFEYQLNIRDRKTFPVVSYR